MVQDIIVYVYDQNGYLVQGCYFFQDNVQIQSQPIADGEYVVGIVNLDIVAVSAPYSFGTSFQPNLWQSSYTVYVYVYYPFTTMVPPVAVSRPIANTPRAAPPSKIYDKANIKKPESAADALKAARMALSSGNILATLTYIINALDAQQ